MNVIFIFCMRTNQTGIFFDKLLRENYNQKNLTYLQLEEASIMNRFCFFLLSVVVVSSVLAFSAFTQEKEGVEYVEEPVLQNAVYVNWWENDFLTAMGYGMPPDDSDPRKAKSLAKRAAVMDAYRNLAAQAGNIRITNEETMSTSEVRALLNGAEIISEDYDENGNCTVVAKIPIYGVTNSVAKFAFKPVDREDFLPPSEDVTTEGNYTGLIIDCGETELNPVLSPVIRNDQDKSIYSYKNLDYTKVISAGMIGYEKKIDDYTVRQSESLVLPLNTKAFKNKFTQVGSKVLIADNVDVSRAGSNPLVIKAVSVGDDDTCPVISADDSDKILAENGISHFLDDGAVVFTSNRIRGMRL